MSFRSGNDPSITAGHRRPGRQHPKQWRGECVDLVECVMEGEQQEVTAGRGVVSDGSRRRRGSESISYAAKRHCRNSQLVRDLQRRSCNVSASEVGVYPSRQRCSPG